MTIPTYQLCDGCEYLSVGPLADGLYCKAQGDCVRQRKEPMTIQRAIAEIEADGLDAAPYISEAIKRASNEEELERELREAVEIAALES